MLKMNSSITIKLIDSTIFFFEMIKIIINYPLFHKSPAIACVRVILFYRYLYYILFHKFETILLDPFLYCSIEYRLCNWLKQRNLISNMYQFNINNAIVPVDHTGNINYDEKVTKGTLLPIKKQFKQFFEKKNDFKIFYDKFLEYTYSDDDCISNFVQRKLWKEKIQQYEGKIVFPYFIYIDDFEINNPLGSHATFQSIAAIYYNFPFSVNNSKLSNILLAALIKSTNKTIWKRSMF